MSLNNNPLVSVIITNFNYDKYVAESIDSVLGQTYKNIEVIIVDDGSTDRSREIINTYNGKNLVKCFQANSGQAAAFNTGFNKATGKYVAFLDSDDFWKSDKIEKVVAVLEKHDYCMVQHINIVVNSSSKEMRKIHPRLTPGEIDLNRTYFSSNHTNYFSSSSGLVFKREILDQVMPLDLTWRVCADVAITRPMPILGKVFTLKEPLGYYRIHGANQWMNTGNQNKFLDNQKKYIEYTNVWLGKKSFEQRLNWEKSPMFEMWKISTFPFYNPKKIWKNNWEKVLKVTKYYSDIFSYKL